MRAPSVLALAAIAAVLLVPHGSRTTSVDSAEVARVQAHLARAESFADARDLSGLTPAQRAARARQLERLAAYRRHGEFPENRVRRERTPVFVDARGVHCAVGHLLALDGEGALVARIAATRNCARVRELADEPELVAWLDRNGLTLEEAARIQPGYDNVPFDDTVTNPPDHHVYEFAAMTSSMLAVTGALVNLERATTPESRRRRIVYGLGVGGLAIGMGLAGYGRDEEAFATGAALAGTLSILATLHQVAPPASGPAVSWVPRWAGGRRLALLSASF